MGEQFSLMVKHDHEQCKVNRCSNDNNGLNPVEIVDEEEVDVEEAAPAKLMNSPSLCPLSSGDAGAQPNSLSFSQLVHSLRPREVQVE